MSNFKWRLVTAIVLVLVMVAGCGQQAAEPTSEPTKETSAEAGQTSETGTAAETTTEKATFTIYNAAGMGEYYEKILIPMFEQTYSDRFDIQYETIGWSDAITKIEAQGLQKGKGNINIVIMGDGGVAKGNEAGVWMNLDDYKTDINFDGMTQIAKDAYEANDGSVVPILFQHQDAGIAYVPTTEAGQALEAVIGDDGALTYEELKDFLMKDARAPRFGRGRITKSGAGDAWTWGLMQEMGEYGANENPVESAAWASELYSSAYVKLYDGTSGTFTELTEGNLDIIAHSIPWFYRLHAKGQMSGLPEELQEDTKGLENAKFALLTGDNVKSLAAGHHFIIPSNLDDAAVADSMEFIRFAIQPVMNAHAYAGIAMPSYTASTMDNISDENVKLVWEEVKNYYPAEYIDEDGNIQFVPGSYDFFVTDVAKINKYTKTWQDEVESKINQ